MKRFELVAVLAASVVCSAARAEDSVTIGVHASFSGAGAAFAEGMLAATDFAAEDVNKDGGLEVAGKRYKILIKQYDDRYRAADAVTAMDRLMIQDGIHFVAATGAVDEAFAEVRASFDRFCLAAGIEALGTMMEADVTAACGPRHGRDAARRAPRWGRTRGRIGFHGGKIEVERPRVRGVDGREVTIPSWETAAQEDWLGRWAMNLMLINVSTRRLANQPV